MDFPFPFIRFLQGDAVEAPLAPSENRNRGAREEVTEGEGGRQRLKTVSITKDLMNMSLVCLWRGCNNTSFTPYIGQAQTRSRQELKAALL